MAPGPEANPPASSMVLVITGMDCTEIHAATVIRLMPNPKCPDQAPHASRRAAFAVHRTGPTCAMSARNARASLSAAPEAVLSNTHHVLAA